MKKLVIAFLVLMVGLAKAQAVSVDGFALFDNKAQHDSIQIVFERTAPGVYFDTTYTNTNGYYSKNILPGIYNIHCQAPGKLYRKDTILSFNCFSSVRIDTAILENYQLIGDLKGTITNGTYRIGGDIRVQVNDTLRIMPGVQLLFLPGFKFTVNGLLLAHGTTNDSITFTSYTNNTRWGGIIFENMSNAYQTDYNDNHYVFKNCHISRSSVFGMIAIGGHSFNNNGTKMNIHGLNLFDNKIGMVFNYIDSSELSNILISNNFGKKYYDHVIDIDNSIISFNSLNLMSNFRYTDINIRESKITFKNSVIKNFDFYFPFKTLLEVRSSEITFLGSKINSQKNLVKSLSSDIYIVNSLFYTNSDNIIESYGNSSYYNLENLELVKLGYAHVTYS
jgi:hypothetical protein